MIGILCCATSAAAGVNMKSLNVTNAVDSAQVHHENVSVNLAESAWIALPKLPPNCAVERAIHPDVLLDQRWGPCSDATGALIEGCLINQSRGQLGIVGAWHEHGQTWLRMLGGSLSKGRMLGIAALDGPVLTALREPLQEPNGSQACLVSAVAVGGGRAAFIVQFSDWQNPARSQAWLYITSLGQIDKAGEPTYVFPADFVHRGRTITRLWISSELVALQTSPDGTLYRYQNGALKVLNDLTAPGLPQNVNLIDDHILWEAWQGTDNVRLVHAHSGQPASVWPNLSSGETKSFNTDGADLAWLQCHDRNPDGSYQRLELWTAAYQENLERFKPRYLRRISVRNSAAVGGGWYTMRRTSDGPQRVEVYSLRDGTRRTFIPPGGQVLDTPFYAGNREIMFTGQSVIRFDPNLLHVDAEQYPLIDSEHLDYPHDSSQASNVLSP